MQSINKNQNLYYIYIRVIQSQSAYICIIRITHLYNKSNKQIIEQLSVDYICAIILQWYDI